MNGLQKLSGRKLYWCINLVASLAILFFGYDQGLMSGVNNSPDYVRVMGLGYSTYEGPSEGFVATITKPTRQGGIVSIYYLGTLIGCLAAGEEGDRFGRINSMLIGSAWVMLGAALQSSAQNFAWMLCARVITGIGTGHLNAIVPVWSSEVAEHTTRGAFLSREFFLNILGVVIAYWLEFGISFIDHGASSFRWRFPIAFQIVPLLIFIPCVWYMPESPRWLVKAGRTDEAKATLARIRGTVPDGGVTEKYDPAVLVEYESIVAVVALERENSKFNSYYSMFFGIDEGNLHIARRVQLSVWLQIAQEWVGIASVTIYAPTIFRQAGYGARKSQWLSGLNNISYMISTLVSVLTIDRWGRRVGLWWGAVGQGLALILAGGFTQLLNDNPDKAAEYGGAAAFCVFLYLFVFGATWLEIPWLYPTETFPLEVRAKGNAWGVVGWSIGNVMLTQLTPIMFAHIQQNTLYIFGILNFLTIPMVWALYPETAKRTLEEIDLLFASDSIWAWEAEKEFVRLKALNPDIEQEGTEANIVEDSKAMDERNGDTTSASLAGARSVEP